MPSFYCSGVRHCGCWGITWWCGGGCEQSVARMTRMRGELIATHTPNRPGPQIYNSAKKLTCTLVPADGAGWALARHVDAQHAEPHFGGLVVLSRAAAMEGC